MMIKSLFAVAVVCLAGAMVTHSADTFEKQSASEKMSQLWDRITTSGGPAAWPPALAVAGLFLEDLNPTGKHFSDFMPEGRKKLIHSVGAIAQFKFVWDGEDGGFTGLFSGNSADFGLIRVSSATEPSEGGWFSSKSMTPGISIKLLRDGRHSANFFAMWDLDGQEDFNFFRHNLMNHVPARPDLSKKIKLLALKFETVSPLAGMVGLSDVSLFNQDGSSASPSKFPYGLIFQPNPDLQALFNGNTNPNIPDYFPKDLQGDEVMYRVYAVANPNDTELVHLGHVKLTTPFVASSYADQSLFFRHTWMENDLLHRPEWKEHINKETDGAAFYQDHMPDW